MPGVGRSGQVRPGQCSARGGGGLVFLPGLERGMVFPNKKGTFTAQIFLKGAFLTLDPLQDVLL